MLNAKNDDIVIHVPMEQVVVRIAGEDRKVLHPARGAAWVEHSDGTTTPITNPFLEWVITNMWNNTTTGGYSFGFQFEGPTQRGPNLDAGVEFDLGVG